MLSIPSVFFNLALAVNVMPILQSYSWLVFYVCERSFFWTVNLKRKQKKSWGLFFTENHALLQKKLFFLPLFLTCLNQRPESTRINLWLLFYICLSSWGVRVDINTNPKHKYVSLSITKAQFPCQWAAFYGQQMQFKIKKTYMCNNSQL